MSKKSTNMADPLSQKPRKEIKGRIPDLEWLFGYGETKPNKKDNPLRDGSNSQEK